MIRNSPLRFRLLDEVQPQRKPFTISTKFLSSIMLDSILLARNVRVTSISRFLDSEDATIIHPDTTSQIANGNANEAQAASSRKPKQLSKNAIFFRISFSAEKVFNASILPLTQELILKIQYTSRKITRKVVDTIENLSKFHHFTSYPLLAALKRLYS